MSMNYYEECPDCGYPYADYYQENSGEGEWYCYLCGFLKNISEYEPDYFDSEEEFEAAQKEVDEQEITHGSPTKIMASKKIVKLMNYFNDETDSNLVEELRDFINDGISFKTLQEFWDKINKRDEKFKYRLIHGMFEYDS